jgi:hypothetical protein
MKIFINSGRIVKRYAFVLVALIWLSCGDDSREITYNTNKTINQVVTDPYVQVATPVIGFQAGTDSYKIKFNAINGVKSITQVKVYNTFTDAGGGAQSNTVLLGTYAVTDPDRTVLTDDLTYAKLKDGLLLDGEALPANDLDLNVGAGWKLTFEVVTSTGDVLPTPGSINVAVLSPYAGIYKLTHVEYWRIGVYRPDLEPGWLGEKRFIGSVDENTFSYNDWWAWLAFTGKKFHFDVNLTTYAITVPIVTADGLAGGNSALGCPNLTSVPCAASNILIPDPVNGKHVIKLSYGYFTDGSGPREFYEVLEKVVD